MTLETGFLFALIAGAIALFISEKVTFDVTALAVTGILMVSGILTVEEGLSGFSNQATVTIGAMFILSAARSGSDLRKGDVLRTRESEKEAGKLSHRNRLRIRPPREWKDSDLARGRDVLVEVSVAPDSGLAGETLKSVDLKRNYGAVVLAMRHQGELIQEDFQDVRLAGWVLSTLRPLGPTAVLSGFFLLAIIMTSIVSNQASAVLLAPIMISTANSMSLNPRTFLFALAFASSLSFATPVGYQTNTMIYNAGRYTFRDFTRVGIPLSILLWLVGSLLIPVIWPM